MRTQLKRSWIHALALAYLAVPCWAFAAGNIDTNHCYAWSENAGWVNFAPTNGGVTVVLSDSANNRYLSGYAWAENIGWIKLGNASGGPYQNTATNDWGVNIAAGRLLTLAGYAWSENCGWIHFNPTNSPATIDMTDGRFDGYAWAENLGWIHFRFQHAAPDYDYDVRTLASLPHGTVFLFR